jgi:hypothetical protein
VVQAVVEEKDEGNKKEKDEFKEEMEDPRENEEEAEEKRPFFQFVVLRWHFGWLTYSLAGIVHRRSGG